MARRWVAIHACIIAGSLLVPCKGFSQQSLTTHPITVPAPLDEAAVQNWSKHVIEQINDTWSENNSSLRQHKLKLLMENAPAEAAFVTRALKRTEPGLRSAAATALKDVVATTRRVNWRSDEFESVQKIVVAWTVLVPDLINALGEQDASADYRRQIGKILIDLANMSRDPQSGSENARQQWQSQLAALGGLTRHPKTTTRIVTLNVLEALATEGVQARPAVVQALGDRDRFVRWAAVCTLQAMGMDQPAMQALATLQHDPDIDVQQSAIAALQALPGGMQTLAQQQGAALLKTVVLDETKPKGQSPVVAKATTTNESTSNGKKFINKMTKPSPKPAEPNQSIVVAPKESSVAEITSSPSAKSTSGLVPPPPSSFSRVESVPVANSAPIIVPKTYSNLALRKAPEAYSSEIAEIASSANPAKESTKVSKPVFSETKSATANSSPVPSLSAVEGWGAAPEVIQPTAPTVATQPPITLPQSSMPRAPESLHLEGPETIPMWTPQSALKNNESKSAAPIMAPSPAKQPVIQPMSAQIASVPDKAKGSSGPKAAEFNQQVMTDILKLRSSRIADQIEGVRSLGKLGPRAADGVPPLAEALVKGEVLVRREVPLALMQIGSPAKLAQGVLERALDDQDTEVRVNAAKALLELSDK